MNLKLSDIDGIGKKLDELIEVVNGGPGSGNYGHSGRLGKVGGSAPSSSIDVSKYSTYEDFEQDMFRGENRKENIEKLKEQGINSKDKMYLYFVNEKFKKQKITQMSLDEAKDTILENIPKSVAEGWFIKADSSYKKKIVQLIVENDNLRSASLSLAYETYKELINKNIGFNDFLNKELDLYRGDQEGKKFIEADSTSFISYTPFEDMAKKFGKVITKKTIKPKETLGVLRQVGEFEFLVPTFNQKKDVHKSKNSSVRMNDLLQKMDKILNGGPGSGNHNPGQGRGVGKPGNGMSTKSDKMLHDTVKQMADIFSTMNKREGYKYSSSEDLVLKQGKFFTPEKRPDGIELGPKKECFANASKLALERSNLTYVEGYAMVNDRLPLPIAHAWCVDKKGRVIDNTWENPGVSYFGVPFKTSYLAKKLSETGVYGILSGSVGSSDFLKDGVPSDWIADIKKQKNSLVTNGGKGSGNFGHLGRIGEVGGSSKAGFKLSKEDVERVKGLSQSEMDAEISAKVMEVVSKSRMEIEKVLDGAVQSEELRKAYGKPENTPLATEKQLKKIEEINRKTRQENEEIKREYYKAKDRWIEPGYYKRKNGEIVEVVEEWSSPEWDYKGDKFQEYYSIEASKADRYSKNYIDNFTIERLKKGESLEKTKLTREEITKNVGDYLQEGRTFGGVSRQEERAFSIYSYATPENQDLRKGVSINDIPSAKRIKDCIDRTVAVMGTFYRGFRDSLGASSVSGLKIGDTYVDKGFMSTSWDSDVAKKKFGDSGVTMEIRNNKKKGGINFSMSGYSRSPEESEVLFNAGTPMKVVDIQKIGDRTHYVMEII